nr:MAG TPA: hypothetical protein [Caudoviricetes sp.]
MRMSHIAACMAALGASAWAFDALRYTSCQSYPISRGKTGKAAERRAAKKRRNAKRRG